jgi:hypothetical protein
VVIAFEKFREYFTGRETQYTIIGGTAFDLLLSAAGLPARTTKAIDGFDPAESPTAAPVDAHSMVQHCWARGEIDAAKSGG